VLSIVRIKKPSIRQKPDRGFAPVLLQHLYYINSPIPRGELIFQWIRQVSWLVGKHLLPAPSQQFKASGIVAGFVPTYSGGSAPDSHRIPF